MPTRRFDVSYRSRGEGEREQTLRAWLRFERPSAGQRPRATVSGYVLQRSPRCARCCAGRGAVRAGGRPRPHVCLRCERRGAGGRPRGVTSGTCRRDPRTRGAGTGRPAITSREALDLQPRPPRGQDARRAVRSWTPQRDEFPSSGLHLVPAVDLLMPALPAWRRMRGEVRQRTAGQLEQDQRLPASV